MPVLLWIEVTACALTLVTGSASALTVLAQAAGRRLNQILAAVMLLLSAWAGAALTLRLVLWLDVGRPSAWLEVATIALSGASVLLPAVISRHVEVPSRASDLAAAFGALVLILAAVPAFGGILLARPRLMPTGTVAYSVLPAGYVASLLSAGYLVWGLILLWRHRNRRSAGRLGSALIFILIGYVLGGVLRPYLPFPILTVTVALAVGNIALQVVSEGAYSPVSERVAQLEQVVLEHEQDLITAGTGVEEARAKLAERTNHLRTAAAIAGEAAGVRDVDLLLRETVQLISDRLGFYHAGVFLIDESNESAVLRAASSAGGEHMLERGHRLKVGEEGIVGYVTGSLQARIALDVGADAVFFDNPDLPETRSEVALPMVARGEVIGALDVQSRSPEAFAEEDVVILQILADQVAIAITNARLLRKAEQALEAEQRARGRMTRQAWQTLLRSEGDLGAQHDPRGILAGEKPWRENMVRATEERRVVPGELDVSESEEGLASLAVPIVLRDQVIGVLDVHRARNGSDADPWTTEEIALMESLGHQLAVALESARLNQDTRRQAARDRLVSDVAAEMRASLDLITVLKTGARGIREAMGLPTVTIRLVDQGAELE